MRTRSRNLKKRADEQAFPIRVRVLVPELGYDRRYNEMHDWLELHVGRGGYAWHSDTLPGVDASAVCFRDAAHVEAFLEAFELELASSPSN